MPNGGYGLEAGKVDQRAREVFVGLVAHGTGNHVTARTLRARHAKVGQLQEGLGLVERPGVNAGKGFGLPRRAHVGQKVLDQVLSRAILEKARPDDAGGVMD